MLGGVVPEVRQSRGPFRQRHEGARLKLPGKKEKPNTGVLGPFPLFSPLYIHTFTSQPLTLCHGNLESLHFKTTDGGKEQL